MDIVSLTPLAWVDTPEAFQVAVDDLSRYTRLAVDTESNSLHAYREQVCLMQFSTGEKDYLIDPLALPDLSALAPIFADTRIEKIFHAAEYDLMCMRRDFHFTFANIFDTMQAGRVLGRKDLGLAPILQTEFGIMLDKHFQRADWGKRPLPEDLRDYARLDTHYLIPLRQRLYDSLQSNGLWDLAQEDFQRLQASTFSNQNGNGQHGTCIWNAGIRPLTDRQAAVMLELCKYRDEQASRANVPPFKIFGKHTLYALALSCPKRSEELGRIAHLSRRQLTMYGEGLLNAVQRGLRAQPPPRPATHRMDEIYMARLETLRDWRRRLATSMGVESDIVLPRDVLEEIAHTDPSTMEALTALMAHLPWRLERFGSQILNVLAKRRKV